MVDIGEKRLIGITFWCYLNFLRNAAPVMAVAMIEIIFAVIEGNLKPSGACSIYANAIKVQNIAGINVIMYSFSFLIR